MWRAAMMSWICRLEGGMYCPMRSSLMVNTLSHVSSSRPTARTTPASSASGSPVTRPLPGGFHFHMNSRSPYEHSNTSPTHTPPLVFHLRRSSLAISICSPKCPRQHIADLPEHRYILHAASFTYTHGLATCFTATRGLKHGRRGG